MNMKLQIERGAWDKIMAYTDLCPDEISGLGKVDVRNDTLVVTDVAIFEQVVSSAHSNIETKALAKFQEERIRAGESMKQWCFWWHSHANMGVFFSGTDTGTIDTSTEFPWLASLVVNKKHESKARLDVRTPVRMFADLDVEILEVANEETKASCQKDIDEKVKRPTTVTRFTPTHHSSDFDVPPKHNSRTYAEDSLTKTGGYTLDDGYVGNGDEMRDYWESRNEYFQHRKYLKGQVEFLRTHGDSNKTRKALKKLETQLKEHLEYGRRAGFEPVQESILDF